MDGNNWRRRRDWLRRPCKIARCATGVHVRLFAAVRTLLPGSNPDDDANNKTAPFGAVLLLVAETKGFEPLIPLPVYYISNVAH